MDTEFEKEIEKRITKEKETVKPIKKQFVVNTDDGVLLNVRSTPSMLNTKNIVGMLTKGTTVESVGTNGEFTKITYKGKDAFVLTSKLKEI